MKYFVDKLVVIFDVKIGFFVFFVNGDEGVLVV